MPAGAPAVTRVAQENVRSCRCGEDEVHGFECGYREAVMHDPRVLVMARWKIPDTATATLKDLAELPSLAEASKWIDGANALAEVGNSIIHPELVKREQHKLALPDAGSLGQS